ncbi:MAG: hypothetical protein VXW65_14080 [Pseudomonadota bacterium]|nr:hypothetical protein [Pseudomonadota bacterium]
MDKTSMIRGLSLSAMTLALAACSGGSSTINTTNNNQNGAELTSCNGNECVAFQFVDEPVINLNYSCGSVVNVTDSQGIGSCPNKSPVTFYLQSPSSNRKISLGTVLVERPGAEALVRYTPLDLLSDTNKAKITNLTQSEATAAINIARLLQSLRQRDPQTNEVLAPYVESAPVNQIFITNDLKAFLDVLPEDIPASSFNAGNFEERVQPWLEAAKINLESADVARTRLNRIIKTIKAGVYYGTPAITVPEVEGSDQLPGGLGTIGGLNDLRLGIEGVEQGNPNVRSTIALYSLVDREGFHTGQAMFWSGEAKTAEDSYNLFRDNDFEKLRPVNALGGFDPITHQVNGQWIWRSEAVPERQINFNQGRLIRNFSMVGSARLYELYTTEKEVPNNTLGTWQQPAATTADGVLAAITGTATISKAANVDSFLDPAVWRVKEAVRETEQFVFPLHVTLKFRYYGGDCPVTTGCTELPDLSVTILENGNIISDFSQDTDGLKMTGNCRAVDPVSLKELDQDGLDTGVQEYRVGVVRAAYTSTTSANDAFIGPSMLFSGTQFGVHDGLQIASLAASPRVKMNIAALIEGNGNVNITDSSTEETQEGGTAPARWANIFNSFLSLKGADELTDEQKALARRAFGEVSATVTDCYRSIDRVKK